MNRKEAKQLTKKDEWTLNEYNAVQRFIDELYNNKHEIIDPKFNITISQEIKYVDRETVRKIIIPELIKALENNSPKINIRERLGIQ